MVRIDNLRSAAKKLLRAGDEQRIRIRCGSKRGSAVIRAVGEA
jgi:hypothetical protein